MGELSDLRRREDGDHQALQVGEGKSRWEKNELVAGIEMMGTQSEEGGPNQKTQLSRKKLGNNRQVNLENN